MKSSIRLYSFFTVLVSLWCIGILAAPLLKHAGWTQSADMLYSFFSRVCHQDDARSFHVEGEKIGVCIRCAAIYFGFLLGLITLPLSRALKRKKIPAMRFFLLAVLPMVVDVGTECHWYSCEHADNSSYHWCFVWHEHAMVCCPNFY